MHNVVCCVKLKVIHGLHFLHREDDFRCEELEFPRQINVVGFISQADIKSPACVSRHLVLPLKGEPASNS